MTSKQRCAPRLAPERDVAARSARSFALALPLTATCADRAALPRQTDKNLDSPDKPTLALLAFMKNYDFKAPDDWQGCRELE